MNMSEVAALCVAGVMLTGCATAVRGTTELFEVHTEPVGASAKIIVTLNCDTECLRRDYPDTAARIGNRADAVTTDCVTPCKIQVARASSIVVSISKTGYQSRTATINASARAGAVAIAGNAIIGGVTGAALDVSTGAMLDHCPNPLTVQLVPVGSRQPEPPISKTCVPRTEDDPGAQPTYR